MSEDGCGEGVLTTEYLLNAMDPQEEAVRLSPGTLELELSFACLARQRFRAQPSLSHLDSYIAIVDSGQY